MGNKIKHLFFGMLNIESLLIFLFILGYFPFNHYIIPTALDTLPQEILFSLFAVSIVLLCLIWKNYYDFFTAFKSSDPEILSLPTNQKIYWLLVGSLLTLVLNMLFNVYSFILFYLGNKLFAFYFNAAQVACLVVSYVITRMNIALYHSKLKQHKLLEADIPEA